jgi:hypothetical protein
LLPLCYPFAALISLVFRIKEKRNKSNKDLSKKQSNPFLFTFDSKNNKAYTAITQRSCVSVQQSYALLSLLSLEELKINSFVLLRKTAACFA